MAINTLLSHLIMTDDIEHDFTYSLLVELQVGMLLALPIMHSRLPLHQCSYRDSPIAKLLTLWRSDEGGYLAEYNDLVFFPQL